MVTALENKEGTYPWIGRDELLAPIQKLEQLVIDIRTPREFEEVHIPGSRNIPLTDLQKFLPELLEMAETHTLTLVCRTQNRVKIAYDHLSNSGISNCQILEGGITEWVANGNPVVRGKKGISLEGQVRMAAGVLIVMGVLLGAFVSPWLLFIPAAVGVGLFHAGWTDSCLIGMILTKLPYNRNSE